MLKERKINDICWTLIEMPSMDEIKTIKNKFSLHDLIIEDILEWNVQDKFINNEKMQFIVMHYPKFLQNRELYKAVKMSIIIKWKDIITITEENNNYIDNIFDSSLKKDLNIFMLLHNILEAILDKNFKTLYKFYRDLSLYEDELFNKSINKTLIQDLVKRKRNIINIKHIILPQEEVFNDLSDFAKKKNDMEIYFDELSYKLDKIFNIISKTQENLESLTDWYNIMTNTKTNRTMQILTVITIMIGTLTMISGLYGMNITLPFQWNNYAFLFIISLMFVIAGVILFLFRKKEIL